MFLKVEVKDAGANAKYLRDMFVDRGRQFVGRHQWSLQLDANGHEIDAYDDADATYCLSVDGERHLASLRLRPAASGCMVEEHFPRLWMPELADGIEVTRFCAAPALSSEERLAAVSDLLLGLCRHCQRSGIDSIFGVVFPAVRRTLQQAGWTGEILRGEPSPAGQLLLVRWPANEMVTWMIQERREEREEAMMRRGAICQTELAA